MLRRLITLLTCGAITCATAAEPTGATSVHAFTLNDIDGKAYPLAQHKDKVVLLVNVASRCGYTKQYAGLQKLHERYQGKPFVLIGIPANNFMGQEPGTNEEIKTFCSTKFNVTFPLLAKISVKGDDINPLYQYLTKERQGAQAVSWNFNKILVGKDGVVIKHYGSGVDPLAEELTTAIDAAMAR